MKKKYLKIGSLQYISEIIKEIESNAIYEKPTGSGMTTKELAEKRHSIVLESNRPVIQDKCKQFNKGNTKKLKIRGVIEGVTVDDIVNYLKSDVKYKKIMTTPESYHKVVQAFLELGMVDWFFDEWFCVFDECEKTIQDIDYRESIILPMNDFFKFKKKAFVSATPIIPSDPRFEQQKFKHIIIKPEVLIKQGLKLITTNNTFISAKLNLGSTDEQHFIFLNSTSAIVGIMEYLEIVDESLIFCSDDSKGKLKLNNYKNVETLMVSRDKFKKYNFFTSRFNSAVDIIGVENPNIIIITDCYYAEHTMVDPYSEVLQIIGRFRRSKDRQIVRRLTHITNVNSELAYNTEEEILKDLSGLKNIYEYLVAFFDGVTSHIAKTIIREMLEKSLFSKYMNRDGSINHFMIDNTLFHNKVNGYYKSAENLVSAYRKSGKYKVKVKNESFTVSDEDKSKIAESVTKLKSSLELLLPVFDKLYEIGLDIAEVQLELKLIQKEFPTAYKIFNTIGFERAKELKFKFREIQEEIAKMENQKSSEHFGLINYLKEKIVVNESYPRAQLLNCLRTGINKFRLQKLTPDMKLLNQYFQISERRYLHTHEGKKVYGYTVEKCKFR